LEENIKKALIEIVGPENFTDALIDLVSYSSDASGFKHRPFAALWAQDTRQVAAILELANEHRIPVIPRGAGTGLSGMAVPVQGGIVMDMARMNQILRIRIEDRLVVVQPGVVYEDLQNALIPMGFFFPPDPASGKVATLGGNVATNAGGIKGAKYGVTRDYVLGLEVVLADGRIMHTGSQCMKSVSGYDLTRLFVGSEGTLGIITEITLKINPKPTVVETGMATFPTIEDAGRAVAAMMHSGIIPSVCEILDGRTIKILQSHTDIDIPDGEAMILLECDALTKVEADYQMQKAIEVFEANNAQLIRHARNEIEVAAIWEGRKAVYGTLHHVKPNILVEDVTVPISKIPQLVKGIEEIGLRHQVDIFNLGHAADGNLHPDILFEGESRDEMERVEKAAGEILALAIKLGGTLTGEHGIGLGKARFMTMEHDAVAMSVMKAIKNLLDPSHILNPGKMGLDA
jgi:glycolate oxidase